jgi:hypothetical protein
MVRNTVGTSKVMITAFFRSEGLIIFDALDSNETFSQDRFISFVLRDLKKHAQKVRRRKRPIKLAVHMDDLRYHH